MRKSQIALLSGIGVVLVLIAVLVAAVRFAVSGFISTDDEPQQREAAGPAVARVEDLTGFDGIVIQDNWEVDIRRGDDWRVELSVPENFQDDLRVRVDDGRLVLDSGRSGGWRWGWWNSKRAGRHRADIVMPELAELEVRGSGEIDLSGFTGDELDVSVSGAVNLEGRDSRFTKLSLIVSGAGNVDFGGVSAVDAEVNLAGATNVVLDMNGGTLSGTLSGFGNVMYSGTVLEETVQVSGFGRVDRTGRE